MGKIQITKVRSSIDKCKNQKLNLTALGLNKTNSVVIKEATPQIIGMINKVKHLVEVKEL